MARCAVPARAVAGGTNIRATLAIEGVAPLHAARTSQRDVPTTLNRYKRQPFPGRLEGEHQERCGSCRLSPEKARQILGQKAGPTLIRKESPRSIVSQAGHDQLRDGAQRSRKGVDRSIGNLPSGVYAPAVAVVFIEWADPVCRAVRFGGSRASSR